MGSIKKAGWLRKVKLAAEYQKQDKLTILLLSQKLKLKTYPVSRTLCKTMMKYRCFSVPVSLVFQQ